ncbi:hypothetical protein SDC9_80301 [bioreactor metagenome]|uniref:Uncharacterized protein n=1 Tax=bioreactor metagenome TaxID=1076179 RepID=A0A644Z4T1_9ZZZZ
MTGTYGIDIELLHQKDVLNHPFARDVITVIGIHFMTVSTFEKHRLTVD